MSSRWRRHAELVIERVLRECPAGTPAEDAERLVDAAYPFGERAHHPYTIWLDVRRKTLALAFPAGKHAKAIRDKAVAKSAGATDPQQRTFF